MLVQLVRLQLPLLLVMTVVVIVLVLLPSLVLQVAGCKVAQQVDDACFCTSVADRKMNTSVPPPPPPPLLPAVWCPSLVLGVIDAKFAQNGRLHCGLHQQQHQSHKPPPHPQLCTSRMRLLRETQRAVRSTHTVRVFLSIVFDACPYVFFINPPCAFSQHLTGPAVFATA